MYMNALKDGVFLHEHEHAQSENVLKLEVGVGSAAQPNLLVPTRSSLAVWVKGVGFKV